MLQRVFIDKNINRRFSLNLSKFCNKSNYPQCLVVFAIVILGFSTIRNLLSDSVSLFVFPLVRVNKLHTRSSKRNKRHLKHASRPNSSTES